jgi:hypothetical protein
MKLLPYLEFRSPTFISPADPTIPAASVGMLSSYVANWQVFKEKPPDLARTFADGTSNTILFAEDYAVCDNVPFYLFAVPIASSPLGPVFAASVYPVIGGFPPVTRGSRPGETFQVRPCPWPRWECGTWAVCDRGLSQTPHLSGMLVGLGDGSVRTIASSVSEQTFWSAVTPGAGDVLPADW